MPVTSFALTHPGLRRDANEDSVAARPNLGLWVVCDGMGGHAAGEVASRVAADEIQAFIDATDGVTDRHFTWPFGFLPELGIDGTRLVNAFRLANRAIEIRMTDEPDLRGMATTAVALLLEPGPWRTGYGDASRPTALDPRLAAARNDETVRLPAPGDQAPRLESRAPSPEPRVTGLSALVAHVGDSRAYVWRDGELTRLTIDHSWVEEQIAAGALSEEEARSHPWRNLVTRALSGGAELRVDVTPLALERGDRVLLCSDGLTTPVPDEVIRGILNQTPRGDAEGACQRLVDAANAAGGPDNITVVVVEVE